MEKTKFKFTEYLGEGVYSSVFSLTPNFERLLSGLQRELQEVIREMQLTNEHIWSVRWSAHLENINSELERILSNNINKPSGHK